MGGMADELVPPELASFILSHIESIAQVEALLLLHQTPGENWTAERTAVRLYATELEAEAALAHLCAEGLLECEAGVYRIHPDADLAAMIARLDEVYRRHLIAVTNLIHSQPRRLRNFADAFKWRKDR